jgi:hypothetical protein
MQTNITPFNNNSETQTCVQISKLLYQLLLIFFKKSIIFSSCKLKIPLLSVSTFMLLTSSFEIFLLFLTISSTPLFQKEILLFKILSNSFI